MTFHCRCCDKGYDTLPVRSGCAFVLYGKKPNIKIISRLILQLKGSISVIGHYLVLNLDASKINGTTYTVCCGQHTEYVVPCTICTVYHPFSDIQLFGAIFGT